jgi:3-phenylpropionate/trans-cinnamate dioxygenase ferredoxin subunit
MTRWIKTAALGEIPARGKKVVEIGGTEIAVFNVDDEQFYAVEDICSHDGGPLAEGDVVAGYEIVCPRHGAHFDMRTGRPLTMPAIEPIEAFPVTVKDGAVWVGIDW